MIRRFHAPLVALAITAACARTPAPAAPRPNIDPGALPPAEVAVRHDSAATVSVNQDPSTPPADAFRNGWMPLSETGVDAFLKAHPTFDGRGVLIAILDSGIDPGVPGLGTTTSGERKILDLRDFSDEGRIPLSAVTPQGDIVVIGGRRLTGFGRIASLAGAGQVFAGQLRELPLGDPPAADVNGNGVVGDSLPIVVARASDGWVLFADTDGDGSFAGERPVHDYLTGHETLGWASPGHTAPLDVAVNFTDVAAGAPRLDLFFDTSAHGTHVSGIAAGHDLYGVRGFDGVAPGAFLLGCKIANDAQGGISTTASMRRALDYAIRFASARKLPLVVNMSFGIGNELEGTARIDAVIDSVLAAHPDVMFTVSAGNDGPGLSTVGFPGSFTRGLTVGATLPAAFLSAGTVARPAGPIAFFSSRGGELAKPDIVTPGMAYSTVPRWDVGGERESGTSMASPHAAGLAALLLSAAAPRRPDASLLRQALMVTARPVGGGSFLDQGAGLPDVGRAYRWLQSGRSVPAVEVGGPGDAARRAVYQIVAAGHGIDTTATFLLRAERTDTFTLKTSASWLHVPSRAIVGAGASALRVGYAAGAFSAPGTYVGVVTGWTSDAMAGPAFRLVNTIVVAEAETGTVTLHPTIEPGQVKRFFFSADSGQSFSVHATSPSEGVTLYLHEPNGMPYRDGTGLPVGTGDSAAAFDVGGRDVVSGFYEVDAVAAPLAGASVTLEIDRAPVSLSLARGRSGLRASVRNLTAQAMTARAAVVVAGAERTQMMTFRGSDPPRLPFVIPDWARGVVIEIAMDRRQWARFTDLGLTLFDSEGRQIAKEPLNYALGRLQVPSTPGHGAMPVEVALFPGFADEASAAAAWTVRATIRLYADSAVTLSPRDGTVPATLNVAGRAAAGVEFPFSGSPWPLGDGFFPLGAIVVEAGGRVWTREAPLPAPTPGLMR